VQGCALPRADRIATTRAANLAPVNFPAMTSGTEPARLDQLPCPPVLLITPWYGRNGVGLVVEGIARSLRAMHATTVVMQIVGDGWFPAFRRGSDGELIVVLCMRGPLPGSTPRYRFAEAVRGMIAGLTVRYLVRRHGLKIAHFHYSMHAYEALQRSCAAAGLRSVTTFHGSDLVVNMRDERLRGATDATLRACRAVTTVSSALRQTLVELFPDVTPIAHTVHNAIPADVMRLAPSVSFEERDVDVLFVGELLAHKGVDVLIRSVARVHAAVASLRVLIAGDGPEREKLTRMVDELGLAGVVSFVGRQGRAEVVTLYQRARIVAVPSRAEAFGLVIVEAQTCGAVVVASAVGGIPEIITDCETGVLVAPEDDQALSAAVLRLLTSDATRESIATKARAHVLDAFSTARMAASYCNIYKAATVE
jgi:L-malate glycosyltransferase